MIFNVPHEAVVVFGNRKYFNCKAILHRMGMWMLGNTGKNDGRGEEGNGLGGEEGRCCMTPQVFTVVLSSSCSCGSESLPSSQWGALLFGP